MPHSSFLGRTGLRRPRPQTGGGLTLDVPQTGGGLKLDVPQISGGLPLVSPPTGGPLTLDITTPPPPGAGLPLQPGLQGVPFSSPSLISKRPTQAPPGLRSRRGRRGRSPFNANQLRGGASLL